MTLRKRIPLPNEDTTHIVSNPRISQPKRHPNRFLFTICSLLMITSSILVTILEHKFGLFISMVSLCLSFPILLLSKSTQFNAYPSHSRTFYFMATVAHSLLVLLLTSLLVFSAVLLTVRIPTLNYDTRFSSFPRQCITSPTGCSRLTPHHAFPHNSEDMEPLSFQLSTQHTLMMVQQWTKYLKTTPGFEFTVVKGFPGPGHNLPMYSHLQFYSSVFGFPDNFGILVHCNEGTGLSEIWVHSELRFGVDDMGVNKKRIGHLHSFIQPLFSSLSQKNVFPSQSCVEVHSS